LNKEKSSDCIDNLSGIANNLHAAVDEVEDLEGRHPSYLGGFLRAARRLVLYVVDVLKKRLQGG